MAVPAALGPPESVIVADPDPGGSPRLVTLVYRGGGVRLDQFDGGLDPGFLKSASDAEWTQVAAGTALWLPTSHPVTYVDRGGVAHTEAARLAGPTLVWSAGAVTYRLEGVATLAEARTIAASLR